jgi:hypothetical protein
MNEGLNNKTMIYWIVGIIVVIGLFLGFKYWGSNSEISKDLNKTASSTEEINLNDDNSVVRPTNVSTTSPKVPVVAPKAPVKNVVPGFDYKG